MKNGTEFSEDDEDRTEMFAKAEKYMERVKIEFDEAVSKKGSASSAKDWKKLQSDLEEAEIAVETVCAWAAWPEKMDKKKDEQLEILIARNNKGELDNVAVVGFLTELYVYYGGRFTDCNSSWQGSLGYIHEASTNSQLVGLVDKLFSSSTMELD
jgi:hypothetical protein